MFDLPRYSHYTRFSHVQYRVRSAALTALAKCGSNNIRGAHTRRSDVIFIQATGLLHSRYCLQRCHFEIVSMYVDFISRLSIFLKNSPSTYACFAELRHRDRSAK